MMNRRGFIGAIMKGAAALGLISAGVKVPEVAESVYDPLRYGTWHGPGFQPDFVLVKRVDGPDIVSFDKDGFVLNWTQHEGPVVVHTYTGNGADESALQRS